MFSAIIILVILIQSCKKDPSPLPVTLPVITTKAVSSITQTSATTGGDLTDEGGVTVTSRGVCWSTSANPSKSDNKITNNGTGIGTFTISITGLISGTTYYVRAYATNTKGTAYGNEINFQTDLLSFQTDIQPIFTVNCIACHGGIKTPDLRDGNSYTALTNGGFVNTPAETSRLYLQMNSLGHTVRSSVNEKSRVLRWIQEGVHNN